MNTHTGYRYLQMTSLELTTLGHQLPSCQNDIIEATLQCNKVATTLGNASKRNDKDILIICTEIEPFLILTGRVPFLERIVFTNTIHFGND